MSPLFNFGRRGRTRAALQPLNSSGGEGKPYHFYDGPPEHHGNIGWYWTPRVVGKGDYPLDLDFSERITRPRILGLGVHPFPYLQMTWDGKAAPMRAVMDLLPTNEALFLSLIQFGQPGGPVIGSEGNQAFLIDNYPWIPKQAS